MALLSTVTAKIRNRVPESSDRWSDSVVYSHILLADMIARENCDLSWATTDIPLVAGALYYDLPTTTIGVGAVLFSSDGTNFNKYELAPADIADLDYLDYRWRDTTRDRPTHYVLLGAPGTASSRIMLWPKLSAPTTETVRVKYLNAIVNMSLSLTSASVAGHIEDIVYVPLTLGLLYGTAEPETADAYLREAFAGMAAVRGRQHPALDPAGFDYAPGLSRMGGQAR